MLQQEKPEDYVIASGQMKSVREFIELSAIELGWNKEKGGKGIIWEGSGVNEIGRRKDTNQIVVRIDKRYFRPTEVDQLLGDASKARKKLDWKPSISLGELISEMIKDDLNEANKEYLLKSKGYPVFAYKE
jgi:GDPmannose 4,6-dehydratase